MNTEISAPYNEAVITRYLERKGSQATVEYSVNLFLKRCLDLVLGSFFLVCTGPLLAAIALMIGRDSAGPVFFRQRRVGLRGRTFTILKFRTMTAGNSEYDHKEYIRTLLKEQDENEKPGVNAEQVNSYMAYLESRMTPVGKLLRATSLDELPQLFNILRGDMSLVGPRPHPTYEVQEYKEWYLRRLEVKPGLTGWSKMKLRLTPENYEEAILYDLWYVDNWSIRLDLKIIGMTIPHVLFRRDAH
ncbi:sugar transferase [bacterium]|nr:sugar transferase [bacterium]